MIGQWYKSHRASGRVIALTTDDAGRELAILQTAPNREEVALARALMPIATEMRIFDARILLMEAIDQAKFFGLSNDQIAALFAAELERE